VFRLLVGCRYAAAALGACARREERQGGIAGGHHVPLPDPVSLVSWHTAAWVVVAQHVCGRGEELATTTLAREQANGMKRSQDHRFRLGSRHTALNHYCYVALNHYCYVAPPPLKCMLTAPATCAGTPALLLATCAGTPAPRLSCCRCCHCCTHNHCCHLQSLLFSAQCTLLLAATATTTFTATTATATVPTVTAVAAAASNCHEEAT
jgi:hypothetical protein